MMVGNGNVFLSFDTKIPFGLPIYLKTFEYDLSFSNFQIYSS